MSEELSFIADMLKLRFPEETSAGKILVIEEKLYRHNGRGKAENENCMDELEKKASKLTLKLQEAIANYCIENEKDSYLRDVGELPLRYNTITPEEIDEIFDRGNYPIQKSKLASGWEPFYKIYPDSPGIITLSKPGFSKDYTTAIVYLGNQRNITFGSGFILVFEKMNGKWRNSEIFIEIGWVS